MFQEDAGRVFPGNPGMLEFFERIVFRALLLEREFVVGFILVRVDLVEDHIDWLVLRSDVLERLADDPDLVLEVGVGNIYHVHQDIRFPHLVERTFETMENINSCSKAEKARTNGRFTCSCSTAEMPISGVRALPAVK